MNKKYELTDLITIAKKYSFHFTTTRNWNRFAVENHLPLSHIYKDRFNKWEKAKEVCNISILSSSEKNELKKLDLLSEVSSYKSQVTTVRNWDDFARDNNLSPSHHIIRYFLSWGEFKKSLGIDTNPILQKKLKYIEIAKKHIEAFSKSATSWKIYAKENNLPTTTTYVSTFNSWREAQLAAGVDKINIRKPSKSYTKEYLIQIAKDHIEYFKNTSVWDKYARKNDLPSKFAYLGAFKTMENAKKEIGITNIKTRKNYNRDELQQIALENITNFTTQEHWNTFARTHKLPKSRAFAHAFQTWNKAKVYINNLYKSEKKL